MTVTMAATKGQAHGGFVLAAGPMGDNTWGKNVAETCKAHGDLLRRAGASVFGTVPSTSWVTTGTKDQPAWGVATDAKDGSTVYLHVLRPPSGLTLDLGTPKDGRRFSVAQRHGDHQPLTLTTTGTGLTVTLPAGSAWDPVDTIIALTTAH